MKKTLFEAVVIVAGFSIITRLLGFLFRIYLSRELGAELLGVYQSALSVFTVLLVLVSSGLPLAVSKLSAQSEQKVLKNKVVTAALIIGGLISILLVVTILCFRSAFGWLFTDERCVYILITLLPALVSSAVYSVLRGAFWGEKDYFSVCVTELMEQILRIVLFVIMANVGFFMVDIAGIAGWSMSFACVLSAILVLIVYLAKGKRLAHPKGEFKGVLKSAVPVTGIRALSSLIHPLVAFIFPAMLVLAGYTNEQAMESYGIAMGMTFPLLFVPSTVVGALSFTLIPELSSAIANKNFNSIFHCVRTSCVVTIFVSLLFVPFYIGAGDAIGKFLYGNVLSGEYLRRACWVMIPLGLSNITSSVLNAFSLETKSFLSNIIGGGIMLVIITLGSGFLGVDALIWGLGVCMTITLILNIHYIRKYTSVIVDVLRPLCIMAILTLPCAILAVLSTPILSKLFPEFLALSLVGVISGGAFTLLCWAFRLIDLTSVWIRIRFRKAK